MQPNGSRRRAFTLVELLVVIAIITVLAALTAVYFPRFQDGNRGADQLQGWLLTAKMQAKRDNLPTGLRLNLDPNGITVTTVNYIQQPNNYAQGTYTGADTDPANGWPRANFNLPTAPAVATNVTFNDNGSGGFVVQPGDYLELFGGGFLHQIASVGSTTLDLVPGTAPLPMLTSQSIATNYRIIPAPRVISGEQVLTMPTNVAISFETPLSTTPTFTLSQNVPPSPAGPNFRDILFAPSGAVIGQGTGTSQIIFWVRDTTDQMAVSPTPDWTLGKGVLITVQPRTGFIGAQPVSSGNDPYLFTRDGNSSGF